MNSQNLQAGNRATCANDVIELPMNGQSANLGNGHVVLPLADHDSALHDSGIATLSTIICPHCALVDGFDPSILKDAKANQVPVCKFSTMHQKHSTKAGHPSCCPNRQQFLQKVKEYGSCEHWQKSAVFMPVSSLTRSKPGPPLKPKSYSANRIAETTATIAIRPGRNQKLDRMTKNNRRQ